MGNKKIIHISNGVQGDQGINWTLSGLFRSGNSPNPPERQSYEVGSQLKMEEKVECDADDMDLVDDPHESKLNEDLSDRDKEYARQARECEWSEFLCGSRSKDLELGFFVFPWRKPSEIVYTARFLTEIHYMKGQYSILKNNCEHFALYCCTGLRYSPQVNRIESVINVASKIGSLASGIFSSLNKVVSKKTAVEDEESENHKNHPVIQNKELDDGGDEELENILLQENEVPNKKQKKKRSKDMKKVPVEQDLAVANLIESNNDNNNGNQPSVDEYADDEEDILVESMDEMKIKDLTPGGLSQSEIMIAKGCQNEKTWNV